MMARLTASLMRMPARQLYLILGGLLAVAAALVWTLMLRQPLAALRLQAEERSRLEQVERTPAAQKAELAALDRDAGAMAMKLAPPRPQGGGNDLPLAVIGELDRAAARHGVRLSGATPGPARIVARLTETPFDFEAVGGYQELIEWLADIEARQPNLGIARFDLRPSDKTGQVIMKIRVNVYTLGGAPR